MFTMSYGCSMRVAGSGASSRGLSSPLWTRVTVAQKSAVVNGSKRDQWSEADLYSPHVGISEEGEESGVHSRGDGGLPMTVLVPAGLLGVFVSLRVLGAVLRYRRRNSLEERGFKRGGAADEEHYNRLMKGMKTVKYEDLTEEQVLAARRRRQKEVANDSIDIDNLELPANHPFAESRQVSKEEEELQRQRLLARRGLSAQDVELLRKTQEMADDMDR